MYSCLRRAAMALPLILLAGAAAAQAPQPAPAPAQKPDDTPTVKVGGLLFTDFTYQSEPTAKDSDGNVINPSSFNVTRAYINVTGSISHIVAFRITPDIVRETGVGSSLNGSYTFRIKYAFAQINLDDWMWKGSTVRFGMLPTQYLEHFEPIYRYRFQGQTFAENVNGAGAALISADAGAAFRTTLPSDYGDIGVGLFNGEGYQSADPNDQKAIQIIGAFRPLAKSSGALHGLGVAAFYDGDHYLKNGEKQRAVVDVTFQHRLVHAGYTYLRRTDRTTAARTAVKGDGWSVFVTPRTRWGVEGLFRYDYFIPDTQFDFQKRKHTVAGVAYWFPHQGNVSAALMLDYDNVTFEQFAPAQPTQRKIAVHAQVAF